jgi:hypothetical protein
MITKSIPATKVRLSERGVIAVISDWDESLLGFEEDRLLRNPELGTFLDITGKTERFVRSQAVVARVVAGETLIVPVRAKVGDLASIYSFNGTGTLIWRLLESPRTVAELATAVAGEYTVELAQAEHDVNEFVSEMKCVGLVEVPTAMAMAGD